MPANNIIYVVYPYAEGRYNAVRVNNSVSTIDIHKAIAGFENNEEKSGRRWKAPIQPGSFNIAKIKDATSGDDAIRQACAQGLKYEPKPDVLKRYRQELDNVAKAFRDIDRRSGGSQQDADKHAAFYDLFAEALKRGPKR